MLQFFFSLRYMLSSPMFMKYKLRLGQGNILVFDPIVRLLWKKFRLPKHHPHWCDSAKRCWMISLPAQWDCIQFLDMLGYEEMKSLTSSQEMVLFKSSQDLNRPWGDSMQNIKRKIKCWEDTIIWQCGVVLVVLRDRLENWLWTLVQLRRPGYCTLTGHNLGLLLAFLTDIIPWEDIFT